MNLSAWSLRQPLAVLLVFALLMLAGLWGWRAMSVQNMPDVELPALTVSISWPGVLPTLIEAEVVRRLEPPLAKLQGVREVNTSIVEGGAVVGVEFVLGHNLQRALEEVRAAVAQLRAELPTGVRDPLIAPVELASVPMLTVVVTSPQRDLQALSRLVDDELAPALRVVPGVGRVSRVGGADRELRVEPDASRLMALNLSLTDVSRLLRQALQAVPGGQLSTPGPSLPLRALAQTPTVQNLEDLSLPLPEGRQLRLGQVASVQDTLAEPQSMALLNGQPVVAFEVVRARGAGEPQVATGLWRTLDRLRATHRDLEFHTVFSLVEPVRESFEGALQMLLEGAVLTVLVVWLFLRDGRCTLVAALALPLAIVPTFAAMHLMGFTLNALTLLSLSLVVGVLVDDAIVEVENVMRHLRMGKTPLQATLDATREIGPAVIATSLALVAVFLPTAFMDGVVGRFFRQFGYAAAIAVGFSLLVARMLTPVLAAWLLQPGAVRRSAAKPGALVTFSADAGAALLRLTALALRHPVAVLVLVAVGLLASVWAASRLPAGFLPAENLSHTQVTLTLPPGATLLQTRAAAERARGLAMSLPEVLQVYTTIGTGQAGGDAYAGSGLHETRSATMTLKLQPRQQRKGLDRVQIDARLRQVLRDLPGVQVSVGAGSGSDHFYFALQAADGAALEQHAQRVKGELNRLAGLGAVHGGGSAQRLELVAQPLPERAADRGVSTAAIGEALQAFTVGDAAGEPLRVQLQGQSVPVVVRLSQAAREDSQLLQQLPVQGSRGPVALGQVAHLQLQAAPVRIERLKQERSIGFEVVLNGRSLGDVEEQVRRLPSLQQLPPGISYRASGDAESMTELFSGFGWAMAAGVLCMLTVLAVQFRSVAQPLTVVAALLLAVPGAVLALAMQGGELAMPSLIGLLMLMGIAAKNAILLVDHAMAARRERGVTREQALLEACAERMRPIVMTTLAMVAGMLPTAWGLGSDPAFREPLAWVVVGGLLSSTVMSLVVVPVVYRVVDDLVCFFRQGFALRT